MLGVTFYLHTFKNPKSLHLNIPLQLQCDGTQQHTHGCGNRYCHIMLTIKHGGWYTKCYFLYLLSVNIHLLAQPLHLRNGQSSP